MIFNFPAGHRMTCEAIRAGITVMLDNTARCTQTLGGPALKVWQFKEDDKALVEIESYADGFTRVYVDDGRGDPISRMLQAWLLERVNQ